MPNITAQIIGDTNLAAAETRQHVTAWTLSGSFQVSSATRDANDAIVSANIVWPDGVTGTFTTDVASTAVPGAIDAYRVTYVRAAHVLTITQPAVTRNANGAVTAQPALVLTEVNQ